MQKFYSRISKQMVFGIGVSVVAVFLAAGCAGIPAPTEQIAVSKAAVSNANSAGGNEFAPLPFNSAMDKMEIAERAMTDKDYLQARQLAEEAQIDAQLAEATARSVKAQKSLRQLQDDNRVLRQEIDRKAQ